MNTFVIGMLRVVIKSNDKQKYITLLKFLVFTLLPLILSATKSPYFNRSDENIFLYYFDN